MSIQLHFDTGSLAREEATGLSALLAAIQPTLPSAAELAKRYDSPYGSTAIPQGLIGAQTAEGFASKHDDETGESEVADVPAGKPMRERGQPSPGKARRTKAEIAEDEAADAADAARGERLEADFKEKTGQNISSGSDDRPDPENADDAATEAADAADEAAEADAGRDADAPLTIDDVKALAVEYQEKYGFEAVQEDGAKIFVEALGKPPEGEPHWKFSIVPTDQAVLVKLAGVWRKAIDLNPLKREAKGG